jgi:hypothetical protein
MSEMKKIIAIIAVLMLCSAMFLPAAAAENEFTPSVTNKPAPEIVPVTDPDGNPAIGVLLDDDGQIISYVYKECLIVTSVSEANTSTEIPEASREVLLDVYGKLTSGKMTIPYEKHDSKLTTSNMVIRDLYDATFVCNEHPKMLEPEGVVFRITFDINVAKDVDVYTMTYKDNEWNPIISTVNNGDGTVTCTFEKLCPVEFSVQTDDEPPIQTGDDAANDLILWGCVAAVALVAIVVLTVVSFRGKKAE